ncbi:MAG: 16S rRNA (uracil(1498)-N(3))-methyltransferase [Desulfosarcina sp.]|nr:16S rRNA (uracil(1498)-N(3))-methyltransferase [Desulfobacterales bacterium]
MRSFFVESDEIGKSLAAISGVEARHIRKVLRLKPGTPVRVTDGQGQVGEARIHSIERHHVLVEILQRFTSAPTTPREMVVAQAFLKDRKMDGLIRALTELGLTIWMPFVSTRSVAQPDQRRLSARRERWARIAREALKQCGRRRLPKIHIVGGLSNIVSAAEDFDHKIMFWEEAGELPVKPQSGSRASEGGNVMLVVGPEGGFTPEEAETARQAGFQLASLGPRILRAETATLAAVTLAQYLFGDWAVSPCHHHRRVE